MVSNYMSKYTEYFCMRADVFRFILFLTFINIFAMKRFIFLILSIAVFISCSDDDSEDYSLVGTLWANYEDGTRTIEFITSTTFEATFSGVTIDGMDEGEYIGTYEYEYPKVVFITNEDRAIATINGNEMSTGSLTFYRQ